jgi:hypothetical protein
MLDKADFTNEEWDLLGIAPYLVGISVMRVGKSGIRSLKEIAVIFKSILAGAEQFPDSELVRMLSSKEEAGEAEDRFGEMIKGLKADEVKTLTTEKLEEVRTILEAKAPADEAEAYKQWLMNIGVNVAQAAKEGGHFGFGGVLVSEPEKEALQAFAAALGTDVPPVALSESE